MAMRLKFPGWHDVDKKDTPLPQLFEDLLLAKWSAGCSEKTSPGTGTTCGRT